MPLGAIHRVHCTTGPSMGPPISQSALFAHQSLGDNPCVMQSVLTPFCHQQHQGCAIMVCPSQQPWAGCPQRSPGPVLWDSVHGCLLLAPRATLSCMKAAL